MPSRPETIVTAFQTLLSRRETMSSVWERIVAAPS